jgi:hypothetical protein
MLVQDYATLQDAIATCLPCSTSTTPLKLLDNIGLSSNWLKVFSQINGSFAA